MSAIETAWQAARSAWPDLAVTQAQFTAIAEPLDAAAVERYAADLYLAAACLAGVAGAHEAFERELFGAARQAIGAIDSSPAFVDEAAQRLRESLFVGSPAKLSGYAARGPLRAWVGVAAARTALMMRRSAARAKEVPTDVDDWSGAVVGISTDNPELELLKRQYKEAFAAAFRDGIAALDARARSLLRMSLVDGVSIDEIGAVYAVHRATAARWVNKASDELHEAVRARLIERLSLTPTELDQMTALVRSQLDVSLSQLGLDEAKK